MSLPEVTETKDWTRTITQEEDGTYTAVVTFPRGRAVKLTGYPYIEGARYDALAVTRKTDGRSSRQRNHGYL